MWVIEAAGLRYRWRGQQADTLCLPQLQVRQGEHLFIRGQSGSGKTTLLNLLAGVLVPDDGSLRVLGQELCSMGNHARDRFRADHIGVIFQQFNLLPYLSVLANVTLPCAFSARRRQRAGDVTAAAQRLLSALGLEAALAQRHVTALSVGQQQRVAVARALIGRPELILADEPTSALDADSRDQFLDLLFAEAAAQGSTILFVSHDAQLAKHFPRTLALGGHDAAA